MQFVAHTFLQFIYSSRLKIFCFGMHKKHVFHSHQFILTVWRKHILNILVSEDNSISQRKKEIVNVNYIMFLLVTLSIDRLCLTYHYFRLLMYRNKKFNSFSLKLLQCQFWEYKHTWYFNVNMIIRNSTFLIFRAL